MAHRHLQCAGVGVDTGQMPQGVHIGPEGERAAALSTWRHLFGYASMKGRSWPHVDEVHRRDASAGLPHHDVVPLWHGHGARLVRVFHSNKPYPYEDFAAEVHEVQPPGGSLAQFVPGNHREAARRFLEPGLARTTSRSEVL
ncbi:hypothetical protein E2C01_044726 [Portunus trituberculatus]|uniref:Uncharacterized protein n=1 Tax=Portunus trituberculatus TaxID=210409 RepID=A0A5B7G0S2_PORTR|nr:hypothetical protein [Portunus trituberculatus]